MFRIDFGNGSAYYATLAQLPVILAELLPGLNKAECTEFYRNADASTRYTYRAADAWIGRVAVQSIAV